MLYDGSLQLKIGVKYLTRKPRLCDCVLIVRASPHVRNWFFGLVIGGDLDGNELMFREDGKFNTTIEDHDWDLTYELANVPAAGSGDSCHHGTYVNCGFTSHKLVCKFCGRAMSDCEAEDLLDDLEREFII